MKFEKLSENKIKITLTSQDLKDKNIDFHSFMSNPLEKQDLFLDILEEAEEEIGFEFKRLSCTYRGFSYGKWGVYCYCYKGCTRFKKPT